jgi:hypothetical protein
VALVRERTIPTERPPLVGKVSASFFGYRGVGWSVRRIPYGRNLGFLDRVTRNTIKIRDLEFYNEGERIDVTQNIPPLSQGKFR